MTSSAVGRARKHRHALLSLVLSGLSLGLATNSAQAAGFELTPPGGRSLGRAGTGVAGADEALGVFLNPATILANESRFEAGLVVHVNISDSCMTRTEVKIDPVDGEQTAGMRLPKVCDKGGMAVVPELANTLRIGDKWALSLGVYAPPAASAHSKYGVTKTGTLDGKTGEDSFVNRTPTRYLMLDNRAFQVFPTLGAAYQPFKQLRIGASFGWGITKLDFTSAVFSNAYVMGPFAETDLSNNLTGTDAFVPRVQVGAWTQPSLDLPLELGASFAWTQDVRIENAHMKLRGLYTDIVPPEYVKLAEKPPVSGDFDDIDVRIPQLSQLTVGARYAKKLDQPVDNVGDRLSRELFDLEFNLGVSLGKNMDAITVDTPPKTEIMVDSPSNDALAPFNVEVPEHVSVPHRWKTQYSLRLGGDYNPLPGLLGLRAGVSYETNGVTHGYQNLDFTPFQNVGLYLGATLRLAKKFDISLAAAHFIFPDVKVSAEDASVRRVVSGKMIEKRADIVNAGTFTRSSTSLALQFGAHF